MHSMANTYLRHQGVEPPASRNSSWPRPPWSASATSMRQSRSLRQRYDPPPPRAAFRVSGMSPSPRRSRRRLRRRSQQAGRLCATMFRPTGMRAISSSTRWCMVANPSRAACAVPRSEIFGRDSAAPTTARIVRHNRAWHHRDPPLYSTAAKSLLQCSRNTR